MKELSIEQKSKAYDEAIDKVAHFIKKYIGFGCMIHPNSSEAKELFNIFPELKESEDERIRKVLIEYFLLYKEDEEYGTKTFYGIPTDNILAWLEKQGEQESVIIIPKFRIGDEIRTTNEEPLTITKIDDKGYWSKDLFICGFDNAAKWELVEQKSIEWSEEDEDMLRLSIKSCERCGNGYASYWLNSLKERCLQQSKQEQNKKGE